MTWISPEAAVEDIDIGRQKQRDFDSRQEVEEANDEGGEGAKGLARKRRRETKRGAEER